MTPEQLAEWQRLERARPRALLDLRTAAGDREQYLLARARLIALNVAQDALRGAPPPEPPEPPVGHRVMSEPGDVIWPAQLSGWSEFLLTRGRKYGRVPHLVWKLKQEPPESMSWARLYHLVDAEEVDEARQLWSAFRHWLVARARKEYRDRQSQNAKVSANGAARSVPKMLPKINL